MFACATSKKTTLSESLSVCIVVSSASASLADVVSVINSDLSVNSHAALNAVSSAAINVVSTAVASSKALIKTLAVFRDTPVASSLAMAVAAAMVAMVAKASVLALEETEEFEG